MKREREWMDGWNVLDMVLLLLLLFLFTFMLCSKCVGTLHKLEARNIHRFVDLNGNDSAPNEMKQIWYGLGLLEIKHSYNYSFSYFSFLHSSIPLIHCSKCCMNECCRTFVEWKVYCSSLITCLQVVSSKSLLFT